MKGREAMQASIKHGEKQMFYSYAIFKTREMAANMAEHLFASGMLTAYEYGGIKYKNGRFHLLIRLSD
jgi:hypothetical protein